MDTNADASDSAIGKLRKKKKKTTKKKKTRQTGHLFDRIADVKSNEMFYV